MFLDIDRAEIQEDVVEKVNKLGGTVSSSLMTMLRMLFTGSKRGALFSLLSFAGKVKSRL